MTLFALSGGVGSFVLLLVVLVALVGGIYVAFRLARRASASFAERAPRLISDEGPVQVHPVAAGLAFLGALLLVIAVFLPRVGSHSFAHVEKNSLIQTGGGWIFLVLAAIIAADTYRCLERHARNAGALLAGILAIVYAVYDGTGNRLKLVSANPNPLAPQMTENADPGIGIYAAGVGGAIAALGGAWILGLGADDFQPLPARRLKKCPDCAETVRVDARVCKHCGYRFGDD